MHGRSFAREPLKGLPLAGSVVRMDDNAGVGGPFSRQPRWVLALPWTKQLTLGPLSPSRTRKSYCVPVSLRPSAMFTKV